MASSARMRAVRSCASSPWSSLPLARFSTKTDVVVSPAGRSWTRAHSSKVCATVSRSPGGSGFCGSKSPPLVPGGFLFDESPAALARSTRTASPSGAFGRVAAFARASRVPPSSVGSTHGSTSTQCRTRWAPSSTASRDAPPAMSSARCASKSARNRPLTTPARTSASVISLSHLRSSSAYTSQPVTSRWTTQDPSVSAASAATRAVRCRRDFPERS
mmetsp:Transcript_8114/g.35860  ORF Transcript_8114/g.35860 Transcript_8114/m.35860 type:complete len:217 (+) Transcript_8114:3105-3755(+)